MANTQSQFKPHVVGLAGGLDYVTPRLDIQQGKLTDCYNFEVADRLGYKRIDGITPFDGRELASKVYSNVIFVEYELLVGLDPEVGEYVKKAEDKLPGLGVVVRNFVFGLPDKEAVMAVLVTDYEQLFGLQIGDVLSTLDGASSYTITEIGGSEMLTGTSYDTAAEKFDAYVETYSGYEDTITPLPAGRVVGDEVTLTPATSMKWYKDRLYITQDANQLAFESVDAPDELLPNDVIQTIGGGEFRVLSVRLLEGSYAELDAAGVILVEKTAGDWPSPSDGGDLWRNGVNVGSIAISTAPTTAGTLEAWAGAMYRSKDIEQADYVYTDQGWEFVDTGFVFDYKEGTAYGSPPGPPPLPGRDVTPVAVPVNAASEELTFSVGTANPGGTIWTLEGGASSIVDALADDDGVEYIRTTNSGNYGPSPITTVTLSTLDLSSLPEDAILLGIEVGIKTRATASGGAIRPQAFNIKLSTNTSTVKNTGPLTTTFATYTVGGANDLWGSTTLSMKDLTSSLIQIQLTPTYRADTPGIDGYTTDVDYVYLKVHYQITVSQLFFWDGSTDVTGTLVNYSIDSGTWAGNDAKGQMHVKNLLAISPSNRLAILPGDEVRTAAGGLGTKIAVAESGMDFAGVPSFNAMLDEGSRSDVIVANFYGIDDWEAMYAVTGAGRAWTYDDYYFRYIYTGLPINKDKPRHIAFFKHHLALGYASGNVSLSVAGEPTNFSGVDGAAAFDVGDRVTALARMNGDVLGVYCQAQIVGLSGTDIDDFNVKVLNSDEGAIEYLTVQAGGKVFYCSYAGISTFDQTAAYGDFLGSRLSSNISPWLIPRLTGRAGAINWFDTASSKEASLFGLGNKPVCAIPVASKNQVRYWFDDGSVLTMTLFGAESIPVFTLHRLFDGDERYDSGFPLVPFCSHNSVDSNGRERIHISSYSPLDDDTLPRYCYELDQGWLYRNGSAENTIHGYFTLTPDFFNDPFGYQVLRKVRAHGMTKGRGEYKVAVSSDYDDSFPDDLSDKRWQPIALPDVTTIGQFGASGDFRPSTDIVDSNATGRSLALRFREVPVNQPPVIFQTLQMLTAPGGRADL
jgi:hypothetical protein